MYTIGQAADYCSINRGTLLRYVKSGELKASRTPGGHNRILKKDLDAFILEKEMYPLAHNRSSSNKILIVDDDYQIQHILTKMLSRDGYETEVASDGFEAGSKVTKFKPGLIILDLIMPEMNGFEVCKKIKGDPDTSHIKVLAITGYDTEENKERIMTAGADGYLTKPLEKKTLFQNIENLLSQKGKEPGSMRD